MSIRKIFIFSLLFSLLFNFFFYYFFESKKALGQGAYCQPLPYLNFGEPWPGSGHLVMTSSTPNVLIKYSGSGLITGTGSSGQVAFWTGSVSIGGNNNLFWDNTNKRLGISTTTPQTSLHVVGNVTADAFLGTINAANVSSGQFGANTGGGNYYFMGNVGIGTTNPGASLDVAGNARISGDIDISGSNRWTIHSPDDGRTSLYIAPWGGTGWNWGAQTRFENNGNVYFSGNVGIGTTNPIGRLGVVGGLIYAGDTNTRFGAQMSGDDAGRGVFGSNIYVAGDNTIRTFGTHASYGYSGVSFEWGNIKFYSQGGATVQDAIVSPSTRMIINTDGNVGIGTTNPTVKLDVRGVLSVGSSGVWSSEDFIGLEPSGSFNRIIFNNLRFYEGGYGDVVTINGGNVGIGTTNPTAKLHILESSSPDGLIIDSPGWPIRRFIQRGGIIVEAFSSYDPNPFYSFKDKIMRVAKPTIDFSNFNPWGKADQWSLRVYGCIYIPTPGSYTFYLTTDDGARFWLNWNLLVDKWIDQGLTTYTVSYSFSSPGWHYIRIDHYENVGGERLLLEWSGPGISRSIISSYYLGICWPDAF